MLVTQCRIAVLPDLLVRKIAAGEVIERPASVVKELIDNALDAGATRIAVTIEDGGRQLIQVVDDGDGMNEEELGLAVVPHATSKITGEDDLAAIGTLGFRGEALASVSAVSRMRIVSRRPDDIEGHELVVVADQVTASRAAGSPPGTSVSVRDLFFNVPARRKFLRTQATEVGHINEQIARAALAHPEVAFELTSNGRTKQNLPRCTSRLERIERCYGKELASALLLIDRCERGVGIEAFVAPPAMSRTTTKWQYVFVNGRYVRDRFIGHAIAEAYRGLMEHDRRGVVFLFITIDPASVDVNVHPTKIEVRWADSNLVHSQVLSALRETFNAADLTPALHTGRLVPAIDATDPDRFRREVAAILKSTPPIQPTGSTQIHDGPAASPTIGTVGSGSSALRGRGPATSGTLPPAPRRLDAAGIDSEQVWRSLYGPPPAGEGHEPSSTPGGADPAGIEPDDGSALPPTRAVQMHNLYIVIESADGITIVDQHALHERIMYDELCRRIAEGQLESQRLLLPETLTVTAEQMALLELRSELLGRLGIEIAAFGQDAVAVNTFPVLLKDANVAAFMRDLLDMLAQHTGDVETEVIIHAVLDMMACKAAIKAGDPLTDDEIQALIRKKHLVSKSSSCPHGRPTMLRLTKADLERQFKRT